MDFYEEMNKETEYNICVFGASELAVSIAAVIACKCPAFQVRVTDFDKDLITQWSQNKISNPEPTLNGLLKKCFRENLSFTTDFITAALISDVILLMTNGSDSNDVNVSMLRESEKNLENKTIQENKIIVQKYIDMPAKTSKLLKIIMNLNTTKHVNVQVVLMPELFTSVPAVSYLLNPRFVFIGHKENIDEENAASILIDIYARWVPRERIRIMNWATAELCIHAINALHAQTAVTVSTIASITEASNKDSSEITKILDKIRIDYLKLEMLPLSNNVKPCVSKIIKLFDRNNLQNSRKFWRQILNQNDYQERKFNKKIISAFGDQLPTTKLAVFDLLFNKNEKLTHELPFISLSAMLLENGASVSLYYPNAERNAETSATVFEILEKSGARNPRDHVTIFSDPYKAAEKVHGIIFLTGSKEFQSLDFATLRGNMEKPAYVFDRWNILNPNSLREAGFEI